MLILHGRPSAQSRILKLEEKKNSHLRSSGIYIKLLQVKHRFHTSGVDYTIFFWRRWLVGSGILLEMNFKAPQDESSARACFKNAFSNIQTYVTRLNWSEWWPSEAGRKPLVQAKKESIALMKYLSCKPLKATLLAIDPIVFTPLTAKDFVLVDKHSHFLEYAKDIPRWRIWCNSQWNFMTLNITICQCWLWKNCDGWMCVFI